MNIQQFHYIIAVSETRHFEKASQKCFITQSTLSTMISKFEKEIGIEIFDRTQKPVGITNEGRIIIQQIEQILHKIEELAEITKEIKGEVRGKIRIGCIPTIAPYLFPTFLQNFAESFPNLFIEVKELTTGEINRQINTRELDIGLISTPLLDKNIIEYEVYEEPFVLFQISDLPHTSEKTTLAELNPKNFWLLEEGHCMRNQVLELCSLNQNKINPSYNINFKAGSIDSLLRFVRANKGKTLLPYLATLDLPEKEKTYLKYFKDPVPSRKVGLVVHKHFAKKKILNVLQKALIQTINTINPDLTNSNKNI